MSSRDDQVCIQEMGSFLIQYVAQGGAIFETSDNVLNIRFIHDNQLCLQWTLVRAANLISETHKLFQWNPLGGNGLVIKTSRESEQHSTTLKSEIKLLRKIFNNPSPNILLLGVVRFVYTGDIIHFDRRSSGSIVHKDNLLITEHRGVDLMEICERQNKHASPWFTESSIRLIMKRLSQSLYILHEDYNIVHADVKFENILISLRGNYKRSRDNAYDLYSGSNIWLTDLGCAFEVDKSRNQQIAIGGTNSNVPPEIWQQNGTCWTDNGSAIDAWGLGLVLYSLLMQQQLVLHYNEQGVPMHTWLQHLETHKNTLNLCEIAKCMYTLIPAVMERAYDELSHLQLFDILWRPLLKGLLDTDCESRISCRDAFRIIDALSDN